MRKTFMGCRRKLWSCRNKLPMV